MKDENKKFLKEQIKSSLEGLDSKIVENRNLIKQLKSEIESAEEFREKFNEVLKEL